MLVGLALALASEPVPRTVAEPELAPAPLPDAPPSDRAELGAIGSDEAPLPPAPAPTRVVPRGGPWYGRGWIELGADLVYIGHLPRNLRILSAGLSAAGGWRPHRWFGVGTQISTFISDADSERAVDTEGNPVVLRASVPITIWDIVALRLFVPLRSRIEPVFEVASGLAVERNALKGRRPWGTVRVGAGFDVYVAPTMTLGFGVDYRLLARADALRHAVVGRLRLGFHF
jgi:hypothetical protein